MRMYVNVFVRARVRVRRRPHHRTAASTGDVCEDATVHTIPVEHADVSAMQNAAAFRLCCSVVCYTHGATHNCLECHNSTGSDTPTRTRTHARTHARTHGRTDGRTDARTHRPAFFSYLKCSASKSATTLLIAAPISDSLLPAL